MPTYLGPPAVSPLTTVLPDAQFGEHHSGLVDASPERVWETLLRLRWRDLRLGGPLMAVRGFSTPLRDDRVLETFPKRAGAVLVTSEPASAMVVMVGQPWRPVPRSIQLSSLADVTDSPRPGWLKYGMEWLLHPVPGDRTLVETRTLCFATNAAARRRFRAYWSVIRAGSVAIRLDIIAALRRRA